MELLDLMKALIRYNGGYTERDGVTNQVLTETGSYWVDMEVVILLLSKKLV